MDAPKKHFCAWFLYVIIFKSVKEIISSLYEYNSFMI